MSRTDKTTAMSRSTEPSKTCQMTEWRFALAMATSTGFLQTFVPGSPLLRGSIGSDRRAKLSLIRTSSPIGR